MLDVLTRFRTNEVEKAVKSLTSDQVDTLMKYIYRGFQVPTENSCGILLVWHEKVPSCVECHSIFLLLIVGIRSRRIGQYRACNGRS